ncbi:MAG: HAD-IIIA family hydrolase [Candidatus Thermoplasmatota archaeon]|nr:HAD-IIIA family hydrolase [Candidatus Thermoplasmatota archaeon]
MPVDVLWNGSIAFLDRDGVINIGSESYVNNVDEVELLPGSAESIGSLRRSGYRICVVTNQSPIGRGLWSSENLAKIHNHLQLLVLEIDEDAHFDLILHSPYAPWEGAWARKPFPGMLEAGRQLIDRASKDSSLEGLNLLYGDDWIDRPDDSLSFMVGDRQVDMIAASRYGIKGYLCNPNIGLSEVIGEIV